MRLRFLSAQAHLGKEELMRPLLFLIGFILTLVGCSGGSGSSSGSGGAGGGGPIGTGKTRWSRSLSSSMPDGLNGRPLQVLAHPEGGVVITGNFDGSLTIASQTLTAAAGMRDIFMARLDASANPVWIKQFPSQAGDVKDAAIDAKGNVTIVGQFTAT